MGLLLERGQDWIILHRFQSSYGPRLHTWGNWYAFTVSSHSVSEFNSLWLLCDGLLHKLHVDAVRACGRRRSVPIRMMMQCEHGLKFKWSSLCCVLKIHCVHSTIVAPVIAYIHTHIYNYTIIALSTSIESNSVAASTAVYTCTKYI